MSVDSLARHMKFGERAGGLIDENNPCQELEEYKLCGAGSYYSAVCRSQDRVRAGRDADELNSDWKRG